MEPIELTEVERWQIRAMRRDVENLELKAMLLQQQERAALTGLVVRHGGDPALDYRVSDDGARLEPMPPS